MTKAKIVLFEGKEGVCHEPLLETESRHQINPEAQRNRVWIEVRRFLK